MRRVEGLNPFKTLDTTACLDTLTDMESFSDLCIPSLSPHEQAERFRIGCSCCVIYGTHGPFVFLIHGWCGNADVWAPQTNVLAERYRVVVFDFLDDEDALNAADYSYCSIMRLAQNVVAVADSLDVQSVVLIGHSMGGPIAIEAALRLPGRCIAILGVDTFTDAAFYRRLTLAERERRLDAFRVDFEGTMARMVHRITSDRVTGLVEWIASSMTMHNPSVALARLDALLTWDIEERWPLLDCPVETINSALLSTNALIIDLVGLSVQLMEDVGHFPMLEDAETFNALASGILKRCFREA